jgi:hypothetical protein
MRALRLLSERLFPDIFTGWPTMASMELSYNDLLASVTWKAGIMESGGYGTKWVTG